MSSPHSSATIQTAGSVDNDSVSPNSLIPRDIASVTENLLEISQIPPYLRTKKQNRILSAIRKNAMINRIRVLTGDKIK
jgi:hypothetical protein